jgi:hypothetical protein
MIRMSTLLSPMQARLARGPAEPMRRFLEVEPAMIVYPAAGGLPARTGDATATHHD